MRAEAGAGGAPGGVGGRPPSGGTAGGRGDEAEVIEQKSPRCPQCDSAVLAEDDFCEECGWSLRGAAVAGGIGPTTRPDIPAVACVECGGSSISADGYCEQCGLRQPSGREHIELDLPFAAGISDRGLRHSRNEDAMAFTQSGGRVLAVVCDGVSSAPRPEDASRVAADTGVAMLTAQLAAGADPESATRAAVARSAKAVAALADSVHEAPACTYVSAIVGPETVTIGWVGDSRAYWLGADPAALTVDDSWAAQMVALGLMTEEAAQADRRAHTVTAWLGADAATIQPRAETFTPTGTGAILLCTDGLWNHVAGAAELAALAVGEAPLEVARVFVRAALDGGGHDNVTVVVIPFPPSAGTTQQSTESMR